MQVDYLDSKQINEIKHNIVTNQQSDDNKSVLFYSLLNGQRSTQSLFFVCYMCVFVCFLPNLYNMLQSKTGSGYEKFTMSHAHRMTSYDTQFLYSTKVFDVYLEDKATHINVLHLQKMK